MDEHDHETSSIYTELYVTALAWAPGKWLATATWLDLTDDKFYLIGSSSLQWHSSTKVR